MRPARFLVLVTLGACVRPPAPPSRATLPEPRASRILQHSQLVGGPGATARLGDWRLENGLVAFVVDDVAGHQGFALSGGNLIDAAHASVADDGLGQVFAFLGGATSRQPIYDRIEAVNAAGEAYLRVDGVDSANGAVRVVTEYHLARGAQALRLVTTVSNRGPESLVGYAVGDSVQWGHASHFAPGSGRALAGKVIRAPWFAGTGDHVSYALGARRELEGRSGHSWTDVTEARFDIAVGGSAIFERWLSVGEGDVGSTLREILALRAEPSGGLSGRVTAEGGGGPVGACEIQVDSGGAPFATIRSAADGTFSASLPTGAYALRPDGADCRGAPVQAHVSAGTDSHAGLTVARAALVRFEVMAEDGTGLPCRVSFLGLDGTPDPDFGPDFLASGAGGVVASRTCSGEKALAPGRYRLIFSRGVEYDAVDVVTDLRAGGASTVRGVLRRTVDSSGWLSGDFHEHAQPSFDSGVSLEDRVLATAAEGVEVFVGTDHDTITDYGSVITRLGLGRWLTAFNGVEVTSRANGHFGCFPIARQLDKPGNGAPLGEGRTPSEIFADCRAGAPEQIIQVNHPRAGDIGYFEQTQLDPPSGRAGHSYDSTYDALEVFNGLLVSDARRVLSDWFHLLDLGATYTATGNSDTHAISTAPAGSPRNFFYAGVDDPAHLEPRQLVDALKHHRNVVTNGPFLELTVDGARVGSLVRQRGGSVDVQVRVQAANWVPVDEVEIFGNGIRIATFPVPALATGGERFKGGQRLRLARDTWLVAVASSARPLTPVIGSDAHPVTPLAFTNPVWVDVDGDGRYSPRVPARAR